MQTLDLNTYQQLALRTWIPSKQAEEIPILKLMYLGLGITGESGEVAEKLKKLIRNFEGVMTEEYRTLILKELGDVLWYLSTIAHELGYTLEEVAQHNINKLSDRLERGVIKSEGDTR